MTKQEVQDFLLALSKGEEVVEFKGNFLTKFFRVISRAEQTEGRLHDGTPVVKINGRWADKQDPTIHLNPTYYPEIVQDKILSNEDYEQKLLSNV